MFGGNKDLISIRMLLRTVVLALTFAFHTANTKAELTGIVGFGPNPGNLKMFIHVPATLKDTLTQIPLIVALHGCSQNAKTIAKHSGWNKLADEQHFIVLYPQQKRINNPSNCFNWFRSNDIDMEKGESASIKSMIDFTIDSFNIDTTRIYVYGLSAGAAMSVTLMVNYPCAFNSGAIFAGGPYGVASNAFEALKVMANPPNKTPAEWGALITKQHNQECSPKLIVVHGTRDKIVDIQNSLELIDQWTYLHHTDTLPDKTITSFASNPLIERFSYFDSLGNEVIIFYKVLKTGHALPVDPGEDEVQGGTTGMYAVDRDFYSTYYVAKDFGLIK